MNLITTNLKTISSREIAELTGKRHDNVMRTIYKCGDIMSPQFEETPDPQNGQMYRVAKLSKRNSLVLVARLSPQFTAAVVDRWQELEAQQPPAVPSDFITAMTLALNQAVMLQEQAPKVEYHDKVLSSKNGMTTTEVAAQAGMSAQKLNKLLQTLHVQKRIGNRWVLTVPHLGQGLAKEVTHADDLGNSRHAMKWKKKRRKFILKLL